MCTISELYTHCVFAWLQFQGAFRLSITPMIDTVRFGGLRWSGNWFPSLEKIVIDENVQMSCTDYIFTSRDKIGSLNRYPELNWRLDGGPVVR